MWGVNIFISMSIYGMIAAEWQTVESQLILQKYKRGDNQKK
ncbi:hypothetical protein HMPREF1870_01302 [Bacteroidales bacterium KA00344]|nr:hypothetical protein HMPREF1870_01302 [Bacteroidales bacterium KA00344]